MSRYGGGRYAQEEIPYREAPPSRWNAERFARERETRQAPAEDYYAQSPRRVARAAPVYEQERYYEEDRYGPGGMTERRYFEEEDYYDPRASRGQVVPFRPARPQAPPRPGLLRRQSSLDTFDRAPPRRYGPPPRVNIPVPEPPPPGPRGNRYRPERGSRDVREYDEVAIQEPEYYGDDGYREYREREWITSRRGESRDRSRPASGGGAAEEDDRRTIISERGGREPIAERETEKAEKPYPRKGKTKMPKRLVHTKVLYDLGYQYYEEDERTIIIEKALGPDNIDEIFVKSKEYREGEVGTTRMLEAPPQSRGGEDFREERSVREEEFNTRPMSEAPRSVRDWDNLAPPSVAPSRRSRSRREEFEERDEFMEREHIEERSPSPARTHRTSRSAARRGSFEDETIIEKKIIREGDIPEESDKIEVGLLSMVKQKSRSDRDIKKEIRELERERRGLRRERKSERDEIIIERRHSRSPSPAGEVIITGRGEELIEVKKDKRERSKSRARAPSANLIRNMMYTLT